MNTETNAAAPSFTAHLLASDKREWSINVAGIPFVIVRSTPEVSSEPTWYHAGRVVETWDTWTLFVVTTDGAREQVALRNGMIVTRKASEPSTVISHAKHSLTHMLEAARHYVEALARLTVMTDALMGNVADNAPLKIRKLRQAAVTELSKRRVLVRDEGRTVSLVCGDAVLVVSKQHRGEWNELTYRVGDRAVHGSYNLVYTGEITSISAKTITVAERHGSKTHRMAHARFVGRNTQKMEVHDKRNSEWMD